MSEKRKKSGSEFRKAKKLRDEENKKLGSFMLKYFKQKDGDTCKSHVSEKEQVTHTPPDVDELQANTNENISVDHSESLEHCDSDSQDIQVDSDHDVDNNKNLEENYDTDSHFAAIEEEVGSAVAGLRAKDKSKSDIDASAHVMRNAYITVKKNVDTIDPATLVGLKIRIDGKDDLVRMNPCQPPESIFSK